MPGAFTTTVWDAIHQAKSGDPEAVNRLLGKYREPVVTFIRCRGLSAEDAEDLAQEVFLIIVRDDLLARAEEDRGRFRDFMCAIAKHVVANARRTRNAAKRGAGVPPVSLDSLQLQSRQRDDDFDGEWVRSLVNLSLARLRDADERCHRALALQRDLGRSLGEIAGELQLTAKQAGNLLQQARRKLGELMRREIQSYCSSSSEFRDELAYLKRFLASGDQA